MCNTFLFLLCNVWLLQSLPISHRRKEFALIQRHELVYVDAHLLETENILEVSAFGKQYTVKLVRKEDVIASHIRHSSFDPQALTDDTYYTSVNESCHFGGAVTNTDEASMVTISICPRRGIRGRISVGGETIVIKPAAYFLSMQADDAYHPHHQHLVYRLSDVDTSLQQKFRHHFKQVNISAVGSQLTQLREKIVRSGSDHQAQPQRRRTLYNNGVQRAEVLIVSGPIMTNGYVAEGGEWYERMVADFQDMVIQASSPYENTEWSSDIGTIKMRMVDLEAATSFTGRYELMEPEFDSPWCTTWDGTCEAKKDTVLDGFQQWADTVKGDNDNWDIAHALYGFGIPGVAGRAFRPGMCAHTDGYATGFSSLCCGEDYLVSTMAHEIGHNWNFKDEYQESGDCAQSGSLMDDGQLSDGFSDCNHDQLENYFKGYSPEGYAMPDWSCLADGINGFAGTAPSGDGGGSTPTPPPVSTSSGNCLTLSGFGSSAFDGLWTVGGSADTVTYYQRGSYYLLRSSGWWTIETSTTYSATWSNGYCKQYGLEDVDDCDYNWSGTTGTLFTPSQCSTTTTVTSPTPPPVSNTDCVEISGWSRFNGDWDEYYSSDDVTAYYSNGHYLYRVFGYWTISNRFGRELWDYGWCAEEDLADVRNCDYNWDGESDALNVRFSYCSSSAFNAADEEDLPPCVDLNTYGGLQTSLCFYPNGLDTPETYVFSIDIEQGCSNGQAIYVRSDVDNIGTVGVNQTASMLFLNTLARWQMQLSDGDVWLCNGSDLLQCGVETWTLRTADGDATNVHRVPDAVLTQCEVMSTADGKETVDPAIMIAIVLVVVFVAVIVVIAVVCYYRSNKVRKEVGFGHTAPDDVDDFEEAKTEAAPTGGAGDAGDTGDAETKSLAQ